MANPIRLLNAAAAPTYGALALTKIDALASALNLPASYKGRLRATFAKLASSFADRPCCPIAGWRSDITDDGSPFELSLEFEGDSVTVRMLVEAWDSGMPRHQGWEPAWGLTRSLADEPGVSVSRLEAIADLYAPDHRVSADFSMWHAAVVPADGEPFYKVYLNPQVLGEAAAPAIVHETLKRLGMDAAWDRLQSLLAAGAPNNRLRFVSLDLVPDHRARVKVYVAHERTHMLEIERQLGAFRRHEAGTAMWLSRALASHDGPYQERAPLSCLSFSSSAPDEPQITNYFPAHLHAPDDGEVLRRSCAALGATRAKRLRRAVEAFAGRDLSDGRGLISWVSTRKSAVDELRTTFYLSPESHGVFPPRSQDTERGSRSGIVVRSVGAAPNESAMDRIQRQVDFAAHELLDHPFLRRLDRSSSLHDVRLVAENLSFFVMSFQDMLRLVADYARDPRFSALAREHYLEDAGHEQWFLDDASKLGLDIDARLLFSAPMQAVRDATFELIAMVRDAYDDASRLALVFVLEATGQLFFERVIGILDRVEAAPQLTYFGRHHQQVEQSHAVSGDALQDYLRTLDLSPVSVAHAEAMVERAVEQIRKLADAVIERVQVSPEGKSGAA